MRQTIEQTANMFARIEWMGRYLKNPETDGLYLHPEGALFAVNEGKVIGPRFGRQPIVSGVVSLPQTMDLEYRVHNGEIASLLALAEPLFAGNDMPIEEIVGYTATKQPGTNSYELCFYQEAPDENLIDTLKKANDAIKGNYALLRRSFQKNPGLTIDKIVELYLNSDSSALKEDIAPSGFLVSTISEALKDHPEREIVLSNFVHNLAGIPASKAEYIFVIGIFGICDTFASIGLLSVEKGGKFAGELAGYVDYTLFCKKREQKYRALFGLSNANNGLT